MSLTNIDEWDDERLNLKTEILRGIYSYGFEKPSPIQKKGLLPMVSINDETKKRSDILAQAQSGTGKTGCFVIGTLQIIDFNVNETQALILAPTHELATQIFKVMTEISRYCNILVQLLVGGKPIEKDKKELRKKPHIIIGTPGRTYDMIVRNYLNTKEIKIIVCDEADEMLSFGFKEQVYNILTYMPNEIQIGLFSATVPKPVYNLIQNFMEDYKEIRVKNDMLTLQGIAQYYINIENDNYKYETIKDIFGGLSISQCIIYCNTIKRVDDLHYAMKNDNFPVEKIHGKMATNERNKITEEFRKGSCRVLITSDLFARGIDVQQVSIVINFDVPKNVSTYLHRIGRSGRWGRKGIAINFVTKYDTEKIKYFEQYYSTQISEMPADFTNHIKM